ncbi:hypothetical protein ACSECP_18475 [Escherichia coli]
MAAIIVMSVLYLENHS